MQIGILISDNSITPKAERLVKKYIFGSNMDTLCKRFPLVNRMVLINLDDQSLTRSKEASKVISESLEDERFYWIRIIKKYVGNFEGHGESWKEVIYKTPINVLEELAVAVQQFFKYYWHEDVKVDPLHIAVDKGSLQLCQYVITKTKDKNP